MNYELSVIYDAPITVVLTDKPTSVLVYEEPMIVTVESSPRIVVNVTEGQQVESGGGGSGSNSRVFNFVDADLDINGNISFTHNLDKTYVDYSVFMPGVGEVYADSDSYIINVLTINLKSLRPLNGLWTILIEV